MLAKPSFVALALSVSVVLATGSARAQSTCGQAYEQAQYAKKAKKFREAKKQLEICSAATCNPALVTDCVAWMQEVEKAMPTIVVGAKDEKGQDVTDVRVSMDGELLTEKLDGSGIPVEYGEHTFRMERQRSVSEQKLLIREGEKSRLIEARFDGQGSDDNAASKNGKRMIPIYVLGGVGAASILTGTILGITVLSGKSDCKERKAAGAPCSTSEIDSLETRRTFTDVLLGVGIVSLGVAGYLFLTRDTSPPSNAVAKPAARVEPSGGVAAGGGWLGVTGTF